ncbi:hypothetical protein LTR78_005480 [Recurvomyces mirabilis]|uniref:Uncharacterized protein n=1 Tax=Recurvomyces mirabilis TaxID=574656 RepID=A0AAE1C1N8_9PEZI|nr:hypothetical protein LTR78_005480 [Recurvomyces mirabilis]KAK5152611.1 hypothetical protein LTS14_008145 [Recurvomyces mirabilis]
MAANSNSQSQSRGYVDYAAHISADIDKSVPPLDDGHEPATGLPDTSTNGQPGLEVPVLTLHLGTAIPTPAHLVTDSNSGSNAPKIVLHPAGLDLRPELEQPGTTNTNSLASSKPKKRTCLNVCRAWLWELLACLFAMLLLVAEAVFFGQVDKRSVEGWKAGRRPGTGRSPSIIAFLTTILEAAVAFAVASCLGQLRWLWFQKGQELRWMDRLTNARQPVCMEVTLSLQYCDLKNSLQHEYRHWAGLGGFLVLALLGINAFTQQIVNPEYQSYNTTEIYVPIAYTWLEKYEAGNKRGSEQSYIDMTAAVITGFLSPNTLRSYADTVAGSGFVTCPSGHCDFPSYYSLAICSKCRDISDTVIWPECRGSGCRQDDQESRIRLSTIDLSLDSRNGIVNITSNLGYPDDSSISDVGPLLAHYFGLGLSQGADAEANASECAIFWCAQSFSSSVYSSRFSELSASPYSTDTARTAITNDTLSENITIKLRDCYLTNADGSTNGTACVFTVDAQSHRALQNFLVGDNNETCFLHGESYNMDTDHEYWCSNSTAADAIVAPCSNRAYDETYDCNPDMFANLQYSIQDMALYMTNLIRESKFNDYRSHQTGAMTIVVYRIHWPWIAYPVTIIVLATMFHGIRNEDRLAFIKLATQKEKEEAYRKWSVVLEDENGLQVFRKVEKLGMEPREGEVNMHARLDGMAERPVHFAEEIRHAALAAGFESV